VSTRAAHALGLALALAWAAPAGVAPDAHATPQAQTTPQVQTEPKAQSEPKARSEPDGPRTLSVVSYNVHGLPAWLAGDDPASRMEKLGPLLARYDVALVQEDWAFHERLAAAVGPRFGMRATTPRDPFFTSLRWLCGACASGLTLFAHAAVDAVVAHEERPLGVCAGWLLGANDCFASKGFQRLRLRLGPGLELDLVNLHLDAGRRALDQAARAAQLERLATALEAESDGRALIVGGDWNLGFDVAPQRALLEAFRQRLGLADAGARAAPGPRPAGAPSAHVDHLFFRSGDALSLAVAEAGEATEFRDGGVPLSDHPAVYARFRLEALR